MVLFGGGCAEGVHGFIWGACMVLFGGHVWFYLGEGMCGFIHGGAWFYSRGMRGFIQGACMVFSGFSDTMRCGQ